jgi:hypothetical protein
MFRTFLAVFFSILFPALQTAAQSVEFGDNESDFANDHECDDRRFVGLGMATSLDEDDNFHDANDCRHAYSVGAIRLINVEAAKAATHCGNIKFGNDEGSFVEDGECDDGRFDGPGTSSMISVDEIGHDAEDCRAQCAAGKIYLRDPD